MRLEQPPWTDDAWRQYDIQPGTYKMRRPGPEHWSKREWLAVRIWYGPPHDPITGLEMDRSWRWQATLDGEPAELNEVAPWCFRFPVTPDEYERLLNGTD